MFMTKNLHAGALMTDSFVFHVSPLRVFASPYSVITVMGQYARKEMAAADSHEHYRGRFRILKRGLWRLSSSGQPSSASLPD